MILYSGENSVANMSSVSGPDFHITNLEPDHEYGITISSYNSKGWSRNSDPISFKTLPLPGLNEQRRLMDPNGEGQDKMAGPWLYITLAGGSTLIIAGTVIMIVFAVKRFRTNTDFYFRVNKFRDNQFHRTMDTDAYLRNTVKNIATEKLLENVSTVSILREDKTGNGYFGDIIKTKVTGKNKSINIVVKVSIRNDKVREVVPIDEAYNNERLFYENIFPAMKKLQKAKNIQNGFNMVPRFFGSGEFGEQSYLFMEDLTESGFRMFNIKDEIDDDHIKLICEVLGKFHALSFAVKHLEPERYEDLVTQLQCVHSGFMRHKGGFLKCCVSVIQEGLEKHNLSNKIIDYYVESIEDVYKEILFASRKDEYSCVIHYDGWCNNFMFKYGIKNGMKTIEDIKLFDWQTCNIGSPAVDLSIALYAIASKKVLDNLDDYLKVYHKSFELVLSQTGLRVEDVYPFEVLKNQWKKYCQYGLIRALLVHKIRMNVKNENGSFEHSMTAEFDVPKMKILLDNLYEHLEFLGVF